MSPHALVWGALWACAPSPSSAPDVPAEPLGVGTPCVGAPTAPPVNRSVALEVVLVGAVEPGAAVAEVAGATAWWGEQGLTVQATPPRRVSGELALTPSGLAAVRAFVTTHAVPPAGRVLVAFVPSLVPDDQVLAATLAPTSDPQARTLATPIGLDVPHDPVIWVSAGALADAPPWRPALTLAHELGHALGLTHRTAPTNLMRPAAGRCVPGLEPDQARTVAQAADTLSRTP